MKNKNQINENKVNNKYLDKYEEELKLVRNRITKNNRTTEFDKELHLFESDEDEENKRETLILVKKCPKI